MSVYRSMIAVIFLHIVCSSPAAAQEPIYWDVVQKIRDEGFNNSHIMEDVGYLTDVYGPRLAKSPSYLASARWVVKKLKDYGLENAHLDPYEMGIGWRSDHTSVSMVTPQYMPLIAYPQSWSSATDGIVRGPAVPINFNDISSLQDLEKYRGKLRNAIILSAPKQKMYLSWTPDAVLLSRERLDEMAQTPVIPPAGKPEPPARKTPHVSWREIIDFLLSEGIAAIAAPDGRHDDGTVYVTRLPGKPWEKNAPKQPVSFVFAAEHYNRIMRILEKEIPVELEVEQRVTLTDEDVTDYNVIADIPGSELADEVVMVGAHLDAHSSGTGAEDNATGVAHVIEAARILSAIDAKPRRTIRFALWGGEEIGHLGSRAYVRKHYGDRETQQYLPEHEKFAGYFNLDYGTGRIRGIYLMNNLLAEPVMREWVKPFNDIGMTHVVLVPAEDIGSDHTEFQAVGLPVFPFLQDPVENDSRTFHTNMDVFDRIVPEYLIPGAVIVASFAYHAAMRDEKLPRVPVRR